MYETWGFIYINLNTNILINRKKAVVSLFESNCYIFQAIPIHL